MENEEITKIKEELAAIKAQVADLKAMHDKDFKVTHKLIKDVYTNAYQRIADLYDIVWPIEAKVLPKARAARQRLKSIIGPKKLSAGERWDKKKD